MHEILFHTFKWIFNYMCKILLCEMVEYGNCKILLVEVFAEAK